jgi:hypothetical protein
MKKLLVLMLIVGFSSTTAFGLYGDMRDDFRLVLSGTTLTVEGLAASTLQAGVFDPDTTTYEFSTPSTIEPDGGGGYAAGALRSITVYSSGIYDGIEFLTGDTSPSTDPVDIMDWYTVQYSGSVGDIMDVYTNIATTYDYVGTMPIVPEPATIALLGLGGLFLLRRRK